MLAAQDTFEDSVHSYSRVFGLLHRGLRDDGAVYSVMLRERHPAVYDSLGQPTLFWKQQPEEQLLPMLGFYSQWALRRHTTRSDFACVVSSEHSATVTGPFSSPSSSWFYSVCGDECFPLDYI